jgi:class 3 adenylate cyclase/tetratricopeptide (TPR) repeat protein
MAQVCPACGAENPDGFRHCGFCTAPLTASIAGRRRLATLVFCDLVGSTALGERVDPEALQELLALYFGEMRAALERHGGVVEKFIGDAVVGVFGVPAAHEDDALRACRAALEMRARLAVLNPELESRFGLQVEVRIGVNSGEVVGSRETFVAGDAANVAARLEQSAGPGEVLLGEPTYRLVRRAIRVERLEAVEAKGKSVPLVAFRLLELSGERSALEQESRLVGRREELATLERELEQAVSERRCRVITIVGEPGVGKSRLVAELAARSRPRAHVVGGGCLSYGEGITFWAVAQIVRELAGIGEQDSAAEAREKLSPELAQLLGLAEGTTTAEHTYRAIAEFLSSAAGDRPLLVVVEDVHWAEPALLDLLERLPALVGEAPLLVVCVARPELLERRPDGPPALRLEPLGATEIDALLDQLEAPPSVRVRIAQAAGGNPLFAEELVAWVREGGVLDEMPTGLNALLGARLDQLDTESRDALERGAVEGELFHQAAIVELSDEPVRTGVPGELGHLARKDLIRLAAAGLVAGGIAYRFKHILVREAAYQATAKRLRALLHERYADWLEQVVGDRVGEYHEILGYHLEAAYRYGVELGRPKPALAERAGRHLGAAGRQANQSGNVRGAVNLLGRATALLPGESLERLELLLPYAYAIGESGRPDERAAIYEELYDQATARGDRRLAAHASLRRNEDGKALPTRHEFYVRRARYESFIPTFAELHDEAGLAVAKRRLGMVCRGLGQLAEAARWFEEALVHADTADDLPTRRLVTQGLAMILSDGPMPVAEAAARCRELRDGVGDDRVLDAVITRCLSALAAMGGDVELASASWRSADAVLNDLNMLESSSVSRHVAADAREYAGDRDGAVHELQTRWLTFRDIRGGAPDQHALQAAYRLANLYCDDGRWDDAEECIRFHAEIPWQGNYFTTIYYRLCAAARLAAHRGDLGKALGLAAQALEITEQCDLLNRRAFVWTSVAEVRRAAGQPDEADTAVATAIALYEAKGNVAAAEALCASALS